MTTATHLIRAAILILALSLAGCSGGGANDPAQQPTEFLITNWSRIDWAAVCAYGRGLRERAVTSSRHLLGGLISSARTSTAGRSWSSN
jgi:hypothetical protein